MKVAQNSKQLMLPHNIANKHSSGNAAPSTNRSSSAKSVEDDDADAERPPAHQDTHRDTHLETRQGMQRKSPSAFKLLGIRRSLASQSEQDACRQLCAELNSKLERMKLYPSKRCYIVSAQHYRLMVTFVVLEQVSKRLSVVVTVAAKRDANSNVKGIADADLIKYLVCMRAELSDARSKSQTETRSEGQVSIGCVQSDMPLPSKHTNDAQFEVEAIQKSDAIHYVAFFQAKGCAIFADVANMAFRMKLFYTHPTVPTTAEALPQGTLV